MLHGVNTVKKRLADGSVRLYYYDRASGKRIDAEPGSRAFADAQEMVAHLPRENVELPKVGVFKRLHAEFAQSVEYRSIGPMWQRRLDRWCDAAHARWPTMTEKHVSDKRWRGEVKKWRAELMQDRGPALADMMVSAMSRLVGWAYDGGYIDQHHLMRMGTVYKQGQRADMVYPLALLGEIREVADPVLWRTVQLALWTAARKDDIRKMRRVHLAEDGWLTFTPTKTTHKARREGRVAPIVQLPTHLLPPLARLLETTSPRCDHLAVGVRGDVPIAVNTIWRYLSKALEKVGRPDLHFHDLRGTMTQLMSDAGCSDDEQASITGHSLSRAKNASSVRLYKSIGRPLAEAAYSKVWAHLQRLHANPKTRASVAWIFDGL